MGRGPALQPPPEPGQPSLSLRQARDFWAAELLVGRSRKTGTDSLWKAGRGRGEEGRGKSSSPQSHLTLEGLEQPLWDSTGPEQKHLDHPAAGWGFPCCPLLDTPLPVWDDSAGPAPAASRPADPPLGGRGQERLAGQTGIFTKFVLFAQPLGLSAQPTCKQPISLQRAHQARQWPSQPRACQETARAGSHPPPRLKPRLTQT